MAGTGLIEVHYAAYIIITYPALLLYFTYMYALFLDMYIGQHYFTDDID